MPKSDELPLSDAMRLSVLSNKLLSRRFVLALSSRKPKSSNNRVPSRGADPTSFVNSTRISNMHDGNSALVVAMSKK